MKNIALILASGKGERTGLDVPKQFVKVAGKTILEHTIDTFEKNTRIDEIIIVSNIDYIEKVQALIIKNTYTKVTKVLAGGKERKDSSYIGINSIEEDDAKVLIYDIDYSRVIEALSEKYHERWCAVQRLHPSLKQDINCIETGNAINGTDYPDMQELLVASDAVITDYSSCIFDFVLSRKPGYIYASDKEKYRNDDRGLYYPLEETPFPIATNNDELIENILNFDNEKYKKDVEEFLEGKGCIDDGRAAKRVVDLIEEIIGVV